MGNKNFAMIGFLPIGKQHEHGLCGCGGFIQQGCVGNFHPGEIANHGLKIQESLQPTLGNLGLVRRVLGVPTRVLQNISKNDPRRQGSIIAGSDIAPKDFVLVTDPTQLGQHFLLGHRGRKIHRPMASNASRDRFCHQAFQIGRSNRLEHVFQCLLVDADMPAYKGVFGGRMKGCGHKPQN